MRVLVVGSGGREHALAWKIAQSPRVQKVFVAPGNGGTGLEFENVPIPVGDIGALADFAEAQAVDLTVAGPEAPLAAGIRNQFDSRNLPLIGPSRQAAQLESSKIFAKEFMVRHRIPTARYRTVESFDKGLRELGQDWDYPLVVKADGLAAGKGVLICQSRQEAEAALQSIFVERNFGSAGDRAILEEFLRGRETSYMVLTDGHDVAPLAASQDYKRALDGDRGLNTGGMGAISNPGLISPELEDQILDQVIHPTLRGMKEEGHPFQGALYAGVMVTDRGPKVLEYNVRLGDPETEAVMMRMESDLFELLERLAACSLAGASVRWSPRSSACVVIASHGYPGDFEAGRVITGLDKAARLGNVKIFHSGTRSEGAGIVTAGGRVLTVAANGDTLSEAASRAYQAVREIEFEGMQYRSDIGSQERLPTSQA